MVAILCLVLIYFRYAMQSSIPLFLGTLRLTIPVPCQSDEQLPQSQFLVLAAPVPYLSRQLPQLDISFSCSSLVSLTLQS